MSISDVNCTPIKPQVSFKGDDDSASTIVLVNSSKDLSNVVNKSDKIYDEYVNNKNVKKPIAAIVSVAMAAILSLAAGKAAASKVAQVSECAASAVSKGLKLNKPINLNLPEMWEKLLKLTSKGMKKASENLVKENPASKLEKFKNISGKAIELSEKGLKAAYKKVAYSGIKATDDIAIKQTKAFVNMGGLAGLAVFFPTFCKKDKNEDGVSDIMQTNINAYTGTRSSVDKFFEKAGKFEKIIEMFT